MQLVLNSNSSANPLTLDVTSYVDVVEGDGMDPANPAFTSKVISHSLLKEGGVLALENFQNRELAFPLHIQLSPPSATGAMAVESKINQIINTPGATVTWQDDGMSQATTFDLISGQFDVAYNYRALQQGMLMGTLRLFAQPFGRISQPRPYAAASGVGPLLLITPYASSGANILGASTQASVAGFGGQQQPSGGVFYWSNPSLAGDMTALLQMSYTGPLAAGATQFGTVPYVAVSVLPDLHYQPLITANEMVQSGTASMHFQSTAVASTYWAAAGVFADGNTLSFSPMLAASPGIAPGQLWAGNHRLFAIARASTNAGTLQSLPNQVVPYSTTATVYPGDWGLYDVGVVSLRANELPLADVNVLMANAGDAIDVTAFVMLPEASTWFLSPQQISPSSYGFPPKVSANSLGFASAPYTNTIVIDDFFTTDQYLYAGASLTSTPSPFGAVPSAARITPYTRGLVPRPQPYNGLPIIAVLGVGQFSQASMPLSGVGNSSWLNPQNQRTMAQVNIVDRTRFVLP